MLRSVIVHLYTFPINLLFYIKDAFMLDEGHILWLTLDPKLWFEWLKKSNDLFIK
jgi:hypothetical protein